MINRITLLLLIGLAWGQRTTIALLEFEGKGVSQSETSTLTDRLRDEIFNTGIYIVLERGEMDEVLKEQGFQQTGCVTSECAVQVGNMLGVQQMIGGSIGKVGNIYTVSARVIDVGTGEVLKLANYDHIGDIGQLLIKGMKEVVDQLITGRKVKRSVIQTKGKGTLYIQSTPSSADVWVDGDKVEGKTPLTISNLDEGTHTLQFLKDQYELTKIVSLKANKINKVDVTLSISRGRLDVFSTPTGANVYIDGKIQNDLTPMTINNLKIGKYQITLKLDGYLTNKSEIEVEKNKINQYKAKLRSLATMKGTIVINNSYPTGTIINLYEHTNLLDWRLLETKNTAENNQWSLSPGNYRLKISCEGYLTKTRDIILIDDSVINVSLPLESNEWVLKEMKSLKIKRNVSFVISSVFLGTGVYLRSLGDKQYNDYQVAGSNADELRDKVETKDSLAPIFVNVGGVSLFMPLYYHSKMQTLTNILRK